MNQLHQILPVNFIASETNLFAEISDEGLSCFFQKDDDKMITGLLVYSFEDKNQDVNAPEVLSKILDEQNILKEQFNKVFISYAFNESILIPDLYYNVNEINNNLDIVYGDVNQCIVLSDHIEERKISNAYRIPHNIHQLTTGNFAEATFIHQYSLLIKQLPNTGNILKVIFYRKKIIVALQKAGKLQIIQAFSYKTADDIVYHMLNVCNQFNVEDASVELYGMIEANSALFKQIKNHFLNIQFSSLPQKLLYTEEIKKLPEHYFSHLFAFALCV